MLLFVLCVNILFQLINPLIMRRFLDTTLAGGSLELLERLALLFIGIAAVQQVTAVSSTVLAENVGWRTTNALRRDLARHCLYLDLKFHQNHTPGEVIERIDGDINALTRFIAQLVVQLFGNGLLLIGVTIVLLREDMRVGAAFGVFVVITLLVLGRTDSGKTTLARGCCCVFKTWTAAVCWRQGGVCVGGLCSSCVRR